MSMRDIDRSKKHFTPYSKLLPVLIYSRLKINKKNLCTSFQSRSMFLFEIQQFELPSFHNAWHYNIGMLSRWEKVSPLDFQQRNIFYRKSELWMFLLISGSHVGTPKWYINMASPYKALQSCVKHFGKQLRNCGPQRPETWTNCLYTCISLL